MVLVSDFNKNVGGSTDLVKKKKTRIGGFAYPYSPIPSWCHHLRFSTPQLLRENSAFLINFNGSESTLGKDFSLLLMLYDPSDLGLICLVMNTKYGFFFKEMHPK